LFTTKVKGTGLGLAIVASRVERHGGSLHVASERGAGSEFIIQLPVVAAQAA
jgi:two-component system, NtrC family, sensor histidine kinase HydH